MNSGHLKYFEQNNNAPVLKKVEDWSSSPFCYLHNSSLFLTPCKKMRMSPVGAACTLAWSASEKVSTATWQIGQTTSAYLYTNKKDHTATRAFSSSESKSPSYQFLFIPGWKSRRDIISTLTFSYLGYSNLSSFVDNYFEKQQNTKVTGLPYVCGILIFLNPKEGSVKILKNSVALWRY